MSSKLFLQQTLLLVITACLYTQATFGQNLVKARTNHPFGTLLKMKVEIVDGDDLNDKYHQGSFLFKIRSIDSAILSDTVIMEFKDETGKFPSDYFELYKYLNGKKTNKISQEESIQLKKKYVDKKFTVIAYETGQFTGVPNGYFKYQPVRQDMGFHFKNYLIVVALIDNNQ